MKKIIVPTVNGTLELHVGDLAVHSTWNSGKSFGEITKINTTTVDIRSWTTPTLGVKRYKIDDIIKMMKNFDQERDTLRSYNPPYLIDEKGIEAVIVAQKEVIANPRRAMVNSESAFVRELLSKVDERLARDYWNWVCGACSKWTTLNFSDSRILENQAALKAIDKSMPEMPSWGWAGT